MNIKFSYMLQHPFQFCLGLYPLLILRHSNCISLMSATPASGAAVLHRSRAEIFMKFFKLITPLLCLNPLILSHYLRNKMKLHYQFTQTATDTVGCLCNNQFISALHTAPLFWRSVQARAELRQSVTEGRGSGLCRCLRPLQACSCQ